MPKLSAGTAKTTDAFKEMFAATKEVETIMLARHSRLTDSEKTNIGRNNQVIEDARVGAANLRSKLVPANQISEGAFGYAKPPLAFVVARDRDKLKVLWFTFGTR